MSVLWINGVDVEDLGLSVTSLDRWGAGMEFEFPSQGASGYLGHFVTQEASAPPRVVSLRLVVPCETVAARSAILTSVLARLQGLLELRFSDEPDRVLYGLRTREVTAGVVASKSFVVPDLDVSIEITCHDPAKYDRFMQTAAFSSIAMPVPTGNLPHGGIMYIFGAATNPGVTYRNMLKDVVTQMGFTVTLGSDDFLKVDNDLETVTYYNNGIAEDGLGLWTSGDGFPQCDPADGDVLGEAYPSLEVNSGNGVLIYQRKWGN